MNATHSIASHAVPTRAGEPKAPQRRVVDAPTRVMHALMALTLIGAYITADGERWRLLHVTLGYTLAGVGVARLLWGLFGPRPARLSSLWRRVSGAPAWLRSALGGRVDGRQAQNLLLAASVAALLAVIAPLTASGYVTYQDIGGEWLGELHETMGNAMLLIVLAHVALVLGFSLLRRRNLAAPMLTGRSAGPGPDLVKRPHTGVAALLLAAVLGFWAWQWQSAPADGAAGGADAAASAYHRSPSHHHDD